MVILLSHLLLAASQRAIKDNPPDQASPGRVDTGMKAVEQLREQATVLNLKRADADTSLVLGPADVDPRHEALGARHMFRRSPEESVAQHVQRFEHGWRQGHGCHRVGGVPTYRSTSNKEPSMTERLEAARSSMCAWSGCVPR
jgi:hypothetical protein